MAEEVAEPAGESSAQHLCDETNARLEAAEQDGSLNEAILEQALLDFRECVALDGECLDARFGVVYVSGLLGLFAEAQGELDRIAEIDTDDERLAEMREKLAELQNNEDDVEEGDDGVYEEGAGSDAPEGGGVVNAEHYIVNGEVNADFYRVLCEVFASFDENNDSALDDKELDAFHRVVNGEPIAPATLRFLRANFEVDARRNLTLNGFVGFYMGQAIGDPTEVQKDLRALGYDTDFRKLGESK